MKAENKLKIILSELNIKAPTFAKNIGVQYQRIFDIQRGKTQKISGEIANKINATYPYISMEWLLSDEKILPHPFDPVSGIEDREKRIEAMQNYEAGIDKLVKNLCAEISTLKVEKQELEWDLISAKETIKKLEEKIVLLEPKAKKKPTTSLKELLKHQQ